MSLDTQATILQPLVDGMLQLGLFDRVQTHEPKSAPGNGLTVAVWVDRITPVLSSGLAATSILHVVQVRVYGPFSAEPADLIDPRMSDAAAAIVEMIHGDLDFGDRVRDVDVFGANGVRLEAQAGYIEQDSRLYRVYTISVPVVVNDVWSQA